MSRSYSKFLESDPNNAQYYSYRSISYIHEKKRISLLKELETDSGYQFRNRDKKDRLGNPSWFDERINGSVGKRFHKSRYWV